MNQNQRKALQALLDPRSRTMAEVATTCGLSERTIYNYLADPEFKGALYKKVSQQIDQAAAGLSAEAGSAVYALRYLVRSKSVSDSNKRQAACAVLDYLLKFNDANLEDRISALEEAMKNQQEEK